MNIIPEVITPPSTTPSVNVFGCGGAGINLLRSVTAYLSTRNTKYRYIDTSYANIHPGEEIIVIQGEGSGLVRSHNATPILQKLTKLTDEELNLSDINIVLFSMSGGSGSVVAPLLIRELHRRGKLVIAMTVTSSQSQKHTENTLKTLKSLENDAASYNIYLPICIFNNRFGQGLVDKVFAHKLERLVDLLTLPTAELDKTDRLHWLNAQKTIGAAPGLRLLHVSSYDNLDVQASEVELQCGDDDYIYDSIISIRTPSARNETLPKARIMFEGVFTTVTLSPMFGIIGNPPNTFDSLVKHIDDTLLQYKSQVFRKHTVVNVDDSDIDPDSGLVL